MNRKNSLVSRFTHSQNASVTIALMLLLLLVTVFNGPRFWKLGNLVTVASNASIVGILACGMTMIILLGGIDLSVAANASFASVIMGVFYVNMGWPAWMSLVMGLLAALLVGMVNGAIIAYIRLNPMITTLATQLIVRALSYTTTNAVSNDVGGAFFKAVGRTRTAVPLTQMNRMFGLVGGDLMWTQDMAAFGETEPKTYASGRLGRVQGPDAAGIAVGFWNGTDDVIANWQEGKRWTPSMDKAERDRTYRLWKKAVTRTFDWADEDVK